RRGGGRGRKRARVGARRSIRVCCRIVVPPGSHARVGGCACLVGGFQPDRWCRNEFRPTWWMPRVHTAIHQACTGPPTPFLSLRSDDKATTLLPFTLQRTSYVVDPVPARAEADELGDSRDSEGHRAA